MQYFEILNQKDFTILLSQNGMKGVSEYIVIDIKFNFRITNDDNELVFKNFSIPRVVMSIPRVVMSIPRVVTSIPRVVMSIPFNETCISLTKNCDIITVSNDYLDFDIPYSEEEDYETVNITPPIVDDNDFIKFYIDLNKMIEYLDKIEESIIKMYSVGDEYLVFTDSEYERFHYKIKSERSPSAKIYREFDKTLFIDNLKILSKLTDTILLKVIDSNDSMIYIEHVDVLCNLTMYITPYN